MSFDIFAGGFDADSNYAEEQAGPLLLPAIKNAAVAITNFESMSNDSGWAGAKFTVQVTNDGEHGGKYIGQEVSHLIGTHFAPQTLANYPYLETNGRAELSRWTIATMGQGAKPTSGEQFIGLQLSVDIGQKENKKQTKEARIGNPSAPAVMEQTFKNPKAIGATTPPQPMAPAPQQAAPQFAQSPPSAPAGFGQPQTPPSFG